MTQLEFLVKPQNKKTQLLEFIRQCRWVRTSEIIRWGSDHFYNRADRSARDLATEGKIRRMPESIKKFRFGLTREDVWEIIEN